MNLESNNLYFKKPAITTKGRNIRDVYAVANINVKIYPRTGSLFFP